MSDQPTNATVIRAPADLLTQGEMEAIIELTELVSGHRPDKIPETGRKIAQAWMEAAAQWA